MSISADAAGLGSLVIFAASACIGLQGFGGSFDALGSVFIVAACAAWAIDNNLTQQVSVRDPFQVVAIKTGIAACVNIGLALIRGESVSGSVVLLGALALGAAAYGISIVLDAYALRAPGAAREAAVFAIVPFAGAVLAVPLLAERWTMVDALAAVAMAVGVVMLVGSHHEHAHVHEVITHDHRHIHDEHHRHDEDHDGVDSTPPHSHVHRHRRRTHAHPHVSDVHHRHGHV